MSEFAGKLSQRIGLYQKTGARLPTGATDQEHVWVLNCLASIVAEGTATDSEAMSLSAMSRYRITVRRQPDFAIDDQVSWRGKRLLIRQVIDDPLLPDRLILRCEEQRQ